MDFSTAPITQFEHDPRRSLNALFSSVNYIVEGFRCVWTRLRRSAAGFTVDAMPDLFSPLGVQSSLTLADASGGTANYCSTLTLAQRQPGAAFKSGRRALQQPDGQSVPMEEPARRDSKRLFWLVSYVSHHPFFSGGSWNEYGIRHIWSASIQPIFCRAAHHVAAQHLSFLVRCNSQPQSRHLHDPGAARRPCKRLQHPFRSMLQLV